VGELVSKDVPGESPRVGADVVRKGNVIPGGQREPTCSLQDCRCRFATVKPDVAKLDPEPALHVNERGSVQGLARLSEEFSGIAREFVV
jgi:hypothetical protein